MFVLCLFFMPYIRLLLKTLFLSSILNPLRCEIEIEIMYTQSPHNVLYASSRGFRQINFVPWECLLRKNRILGFCLLPWLRIFRGNFSKALSVRRSSQLVENADEVSAWAHAAVWRYSLISKTEPLQTGFMLLSYHFSSRDSANSDCKSIHLDYFSSLLISQSASSSLILPKLARNVSINYQRINPKVHQTRPVTGHTTGREKKIQFKSGADFKTHFNNGTLFQLCCSSPPQLTLVLTVANIQKHFN